MQRTRSMGDDKRAGTATAGRMIYGRMPDGTIGWFPSKASEKIRSGIGDHLACEVQREIEGLKDREAGRKIGLSRRAIRRLRAQAPLKKVSIGFPAPLK
jgi:hypothetical protein